MKTNEMMNFITKTGSGQSQHEDEWIDPYIINGSEFLFFPFSLQVAEPEDYTVDYGERAEHCWNGAHNLSNAVSVRKTHIF
jgi:hypothetical protein